MRAYPLPLHYYPFAIGTPTYPKSFHRLHNSALSIALRRLLSCCTRLAVLIPALDLPLQVIVTQAAPFFAIARRISPPSST